MGEHTPGPWFYEFSAPSTHYVTTDRAPFGPVVCQMWSGGDSKHAEEANARLIAEAPAMKAALEAAEALYKKGILNATVEEVDAVRDMRRSVLSRIGGEP